MYAIKYAPFYYDNMGRNFPTEEDFDTVEDAMSYLRTGYPEYTKAVGDESWMGVVCEGINYDENGVYLRGEIRSTIVEPSGKILWDFNDNIIFARFSP